MADSMERLVGLAGTGSASRRRGAPRGIGLSIAEPAEIIGAADGVEDASRPPGGPVDTAR